MIIGVLRWGWVAVSGDSSGQSGDESYKYLGTELRTGWANGESQTEMRKRCVADCKRVIWIIGNLPHLTGEQIRRNMALALSGIIGYYGRSTAITSHMERLPEYRTSEGGRTKRKRVFGLGNPTTTNI